MIDESAVGEIRRLLAQGRFSQRHIAQLVGVSRGTVNAIAQGRRPTHPPHRGGDDECVPPSGLPARCPGCGGLVQMPCLACRVRSLKAAGL